MVDNPSTWQPAESWRQFRLQTEAVKNYPFGYYMYIGQTHRDWFLDRTLPALLYLKAVSILDESLELWLDSSTHHLASPYGNNLNGRLRYLNDNGLLGNVAQLHEIRSRRNLLAHDPDDSCDWATLEKDMAVVESALIALGLATPTPNLEFYFERSAMQECQEPGVKYSRTLSYGVKEDGRVALEVSWTQRFSGP